MLEELPDVLLALCSVGQICCCCCLVRTISMSRLYLNACNTAAASIPDCRDAFREASSPVCCSLEYVERINIYDERLRKRSSPWRQYTFRAALDENWA